MGAQAEPYSAESPLMPRTPLPLFEKSNVLVMCVLLSFPEKSAWILELKCSGFTAVPQVQVGCLAAEVKPCSRCPGKTLLAKTLAKVLDVPFSVSDATTFTQVSGTRFLKVLSSRTRSQLFRPDVRVPP